jgi:hypothetical protein
MATMIDKVCPGCGVTFTVTMEKKKQRTCKAAECVFKVRSIASSARMKHRRNGGDPALNAILAKACGAHLKRMWEKPEFREMHRAMSTVKIAAYMADEARRRLRDDTNKRLMGNAARRLRRDADFTELMSAKTMEYMRQEPFRHDQHGEYTPGYVSMIMSRVNNDAEVRALCDTRMSLYLKDEQAKYRASKG